MPRKRQRSRPFFYALVYGILGVTLLLLLLPQMISLGLRYGLSQSGAGAAEIGNVDINLFNGTVAFDELRLYRSAAQLLHLQHGEMEIAWRDLFNKRLHIQRLRLQGLSLTISQSSQGPLRIAGFPLPATDKPASPAQPASWGFGIDEVELQDNSIQLIRTGLVLNLGIEQFKLGPLKSWEASQPSPVIAKLSLDKTQLNIDATTTPLAQQPAADIKLQLTALNLGLAQPLLPQTVGRLEGQLSADLRIRLNNRQGQLFITPQGALTLQGVKLTQAQQQFMSDSLSWQGKTDIAIGSRQIRAALNGKLQSGAFAARIPGSNLSVSGSALTWEGKTTTSIDNNVELTAEGEARVEKIALTSLTAETPHTRLAELSLQQLNLKNLNQLQIEKVTLGGLQAKLRLTQQGLMPLQLHRPQTGGIPTATKDAADTPPFQFRVGEISLNGNNNIEFEDATVNPPFRQRLSPETITVGALDSTTPSQPTPLTVTTRVGEHSSLNVQGQLKPLAQPFSLALKAHLKDYEMPPLTPYLVKMLGYKINSGQLDSKITFNLSGDNLKGEAKIEARQLDMEPEDPERIAQFEQQSSMPINTALGLLRDKQNNIQLSIPFSGNLSDPKFDLSDAINTALAKTMKSAAISYLKYLLQPYSSVITLMELAGKAGGGIRLEPIAFPAGSAEPGPDTAGYIERLATLFKQRENLQLRLCGIATTADLIALSEGKLKEIPPGPNDQLEQLARARAEAIKQILIADYGIQASKLFICNPELDRTADAIPRVRLQL